jgi:hypothetical protein
MGQNGTCVELIYFSIPAHITRIPPSFIKTPSSEPGGSGANNDFLIRHLLFVRKSINKRKNRIKKKNRVEG